MQKFVVVVQGQGKEMSAGSVEEEPHRVFVALVRGPKIAVGPLPRFGEAIVGNNILPFMPLFTHIVVPVILVDSRFVHHQTIVPIRRLASQNTWQRLFGRAPGRGVQNGGTLVGNIV